MRKRPLIYIVFILASSLLLSACTIPFLGKNKKAALQVNSLPKSSVFLNGQHVGTTPFFDEELKEGEFVVKLVPETTGATVDSWEGRVKLTSGILTVVSRSLGAVEEDSSGYILTLEPTTDNSKSAISIVSTPDKAIVTIDGEPKGFAPHNVDDLEQGEHTVGVSLPGYLKQEIQAKAVNGYKLVLVVQLAKDKTEEREEDKTATESAELSDEDEQTDEETEEETEEETNTSETRQATDSAKPARPYVTIKSPEAGWVRIREEASTTSTELGKAYDGDSYPLLDTTDVGWYQIEYEEGKKGWISGRYAEKYE